MYGCYRHLIISESLLYLQDNPKFLVHESSRISLLLPPTGQIRFHMWYYLLLLRHRRNVNFSAHWSAVADPLRAECARAFLRDDDDDRRYTLYFIIAASIISLSHSLSLSFSLCRRAMKVRTVRGAHRLYPASSASSSERRQPPYTIRAYIAVTVDWWCRY